MKKLLLFPIFLFAGLQLYSQSDNCSTATPINLSGGTACVNGTTVGATSDGIVTSCNSSPVNFVWYQYTTTGTNNQITLTPATLQNAVLIIDSSPCGDASIDFCNSATGSNAITLLDALPIGTTIRISIASTSGSQGTFQLCVNSYTPTNTSAGDECTNAIPYCDITSTLNIPSMSSYTGSGSKPSCFSGPGSSPAQDMFITFTVTQNGTIAWTGDPVNSSTEFDWALYNNTSGCLGTQISCNYNYAFATGLNFGMTGSSNSGEFNATLNGVAGQTYTIRINNFSANGTGFDFTWQGTAQISPVASFTINPSTVTCGSSVTVNITNTSTGIPTWTFGNGTTYTGSTPPAQTYTTPGTYAITATIGGACPSTMTRYVKLYGPLAITTTGTNTSCPSSCDGGATVSSISGGDGVYTYSWSNGATTPSITGLCTGTYTVTANNATCGTTATSTVTITSTNPAPTVTVPANVTTCPGSTVAATSFTTTPAGATYTWTNSNTATGLAASGTGNIAAFTATNTGSTVLTSTITVTPTLAGCVGAPSSYTVTVNPKPTVAVNSPTICEGQTANLTATGATSYTWSVGATSTGTNTADATPASTTSYTVTGTTNGCSNTAVATVTVTPLPTVAVNSPTICAGQTANLTATGATYYIWSVGATSTGTNTADATPASTASYTVTGTTNGCSSTAVATVTVTPLPTVAVNSPTICAGQTANLTATGATSYTWGVGATSTGSSTAVASPLTTTNYSVTGTSNGCSDTVMSIVTVNSAPIITVNSETICAGQTANLTANGATSYTWSAGAISTGINTANASPDTTTSYTVTGTIEGGCPGMAVSIVTVNPVPVVIANSLTICSGSVANLSASGATSYTWSTGATSTGTNTATASPYSTASYTVTGTSSGCSNTTVATVTVTPLPSVTVNSPIICTGQTANLIATGATTYSWSTGATSTGTNTANATPVSTTSYTVTGITNGCFGTSVATITVVPSPIITVNSPTICAGETANLTANGGTTYTWSTGVVSTGINTADAAPSITSIYTATGTTNGCSSTAVATVTVTPLPIVTVNSPTICAGETANLTANGATSYIWSVGVTPNSINTAIALPPTTTSYAVTGITSGCSNIIILTVSVNPAPLVTVNSTSICPGETANLVANGAATYTWSAGAISTGTNTSDAAPDSTTTYIVTGTANGCSDTALSTVTVNPLPIVTVNSPAICLGATSSIIASGAATYTWSTGIASTGTNTADASPVTTTIYTVTGTSLGCSDTTIFTVIVNPIPDADFTAPQSTSIFTPIINYTDQSTISSGMITSWSWSFGDDTDSISTLQNPSHQFSEVGTYCTHLVVTSDAGCTDSADLCIVIEPEFTFFIPNAFSPNGDGINDEFYAKGEGIKKFQMSIYDRWGMEVFFADDINDRWDGKANYGEKVAQIDVYIWKVLLTDAFDIKHRYTGTVSTIR